MQPSTSDHSETMISSSRLSSKWMKVIVLTFCLCILIVVILVGFYVIKNSSNSTSIANGQTSSSEISSSESTSSESAIANWTEYKYDFPYTNPPFSFSYPTDWNIETNDSSGSWDVTLTKDKNQIKVDFSANDQSSFEDSLEFWMMDLSPKKKDFTSSVVNIGTIDGAEYKEFYVQRENGEQFYAVIMNVTSSYGGYGQLAIKTNNTGLQSILEQMISKVDRKT